MDPKRTRRGGNRWKLRVIAPGNKGTGRLEMTSERDGHSFLALYKVEANKLTVCYRESKLGYPADFTNRQQWMNILNRKKM